MGVIKMDRIEPFSVCNTLNEEEKEKVGSFLNTLTVEELDALSILCKEMYNIGKHNVGE